MTKPSKARADADGGWKDIIEDFTEEFFEFYFPEVHAAVDFSHAPEFLDTELRQIMPDSGEARRHVDRLIKVMLKAGGEQWLYVHVEVQGETEETAEQFAERMYVYNYRICDRHGKSVVSLAVLADSEASFRPTEYRRELLGNVLSFRFPSVKLIEMDQDELDASGKAFALVTRIQLAYGKVRRDPRRRFDRKLALTRELYRKGFDRERIVRLFRFLDFIMRLPEPLEIQYRHELEAIEGALKMPYVTSVERLARREGRAEGRTAGLTEGQLQGLREAVLDALEARFGEIPYQTREAIGRIGSDAALRKLHRLAVTVKSLDAFSV